jgi:phage tail sheath protein FI
MASSYKTPGVFVEEIPKLPPSVAEVETAIPAFIGYTEKAEKNGENIKGIPTRISSLIEFDTYFGGPYSLLPGDIQVVLDEANNFAVKNVLYTQKVFFLYDSLRLFFDNGGGDCYIVAVDFYNTTVFSAGGQLQNENALSAGLSALEKYTEPTIIVIPDAVSLDEAPFYGLQQAMIAQCAKLQDRVAVMDLRENKETWSDSYTKFRNSIGISNLKYAAAYTPWMYTSYSRSIDYELLRNQGTVHAIRNAANTADIDLFTVTTDSDMNKLVATTNNATDDELTLQADYKTLRTDTVDNTKVYATLTDKYNKLKSDILTATAANSDDRFNDLINFVRAIADTFPHWRTTGDAKKIKNDDLTNALDASAKDTTNGLRKHMKDFIAFEKNDQVDDITGGAHVFTAYNNLPAAAANSWLGITDVAATTASPAGIPALATPFGATTTDAEKRAAIMLMMPVLEPTFKGIASFFDNILAAAATYKDLSQNALYNGHPVVSGIIKAITKLISSVPPSGPVAGIYARVDNARGVWKAPANESINSVTGPRVQITANEQANLNVDAVAGKSINAIRTFVGRGNAIVWGARTLAGNDNEWRYISVRRFFNMVEESSKNATEQFVFEPNDENTWVKVQGMIENFLTVLWRQGALQGAKPEHAFYVAVGLGKTMTPLDILEGRMIVEIGMAVVRPAEFIILRFSHKMAES